MIIAGKISWGFPELLACRFLGSYRYFAGSLNTGMAWNWMTVLGTLLFFTGAGVLTLVGHILRMKWGPNMLSGLRFIDCV